MATATLGRDDLSLSPAIAARAREAREFFSRADAKEMSPEDASGIDPQPVPYKSETAWEDEDRWTLVALVRDAKADKARVLKQAMYIMDHGSPKVRADLCELVSILYERVTHDRN